MMSLLAQYPAIAGFGFGLIIGAIVFYLLGYDRGHIEGFDTGLYRAGLRKNKNFNPIK